MVKQFREHSIDSQYLNPPLIVTLSMQEEVLKANKNYFEQFGFEIENFGGRISHQCGTIESVRTDRGRTVSGNVVAN